MRPAIYHFLQRLPLTPNGKLDHSALLVMAGSAILSNLSASGSNSDSLMLASQTEKTLFSLWSRFLRTGDIAFDTDFFESGGDSIVSTRIAGAARKEGLNFTARDIFEAPTISKLAARINHRVSASTTQSTHTQSSNTQAAIHVQLTPIQRWFFNIPMPIRTHWNMAMQVLIAKDFDLDKLSQAHAQLALSQHTLRTRFYFQDNQWHSEIMPYASAVIVKRIDVAAEQTLALNDLIQQAISKLVSEFDLAQGRLFGFVRVEGLTGELDRLVLIAHHLLMDGISWQIYLEEIERVYEGVEPSFPDCQMAEWSQLLHDRALSSDATRACIQWQAINQEHPLWEMPYDQPSGSELEGFAQTVELSIDAHQTKVLTRVIASGLGVGVDDLLLSALKTALGRWSGNINSPVVNVEAHGRDAVDAPFTTGSTLGWFTTYYPLTLTESDPVKIAHARRTLPGHGREFLLLRHGPDQRLTRELSVCEGPISFNYLGRIFDFNSSSIFKGLAHSNLGPMHHCEAIRPNALAINAAVIDHELSLTIEYSSDKFKAVTIQRLAEYFKTAMSDLIAKYPFKNKFSSEENCFPLTPVQRGMLLHGDFGVYVTVLRMRFRALDTRMLMLAWQRLVADEPMLRLVVRGEHGVVLSEMQPVVRIEDFTQQGDLVDTALDTLAKSELNKGINVTTGPLARVIAIDLPNDGQELIFIIHHLILDGWSNPILMAALFAHYDDLQKNISYRSKRLDTHSFADYANWLSANDSEFAAKSYWSDRFGSWSGDACLSIEHGSLSSASRDSLREVLSPEESLSLVSAAKIARVTPAVIYQAALALLMGRYSDQNDVVFGMTLSGRSAPVDGIDSMVGMFINTLPVRVAFSDSESVMSLLRRLHVEFASLSEHEHDSVAMISQWAGLTPRQSLFDIALVIESFPAEALSNLDIDVELTSMSTIETTQFPLTLAILPGNEVLIEVSFDTARYHRNLIEMFVLHYKRVLLQLCTVEQLNQIELLSEQERHVVFEAGFGPIIPLPDRGCLISLVQWSNYPALSLEVAYLSERLRSYKGLKVAICLSRGSALNAAMLAVFASAAVLVPIDPALPDLRIITLLKDSGARCIIVDDVFISRAIEVNIDVLAIDAQSSDWSTGQPVLVSDHGCLSDPAYILYTSGSSGIPKGVVISHQALLNHSLAVIADYELTPTDIVLQMAAPGFDVYLEELLPSLIAGAKLISLPADASLEPAALIEYIALNQLTVLNLPTGYWSVLAGSLSQGLVLPASVRLVIIGGERASPRALENWRAARTSIPLINAYGLTETTITSTTWRDDGAPLHFAGVPVGRPLANQQVFVLDRARRLVPVGVVGTLWIGGEGLALGYLRNGEIVDSCQAIELGDRSLRLFDTGDLARYDVHGAIEIIGRRDQQVQLRGFRIELNEVQRVLESYAGVRQVCVAVSQDVLRVFIAGAVDPQVLLAYARKLLPPALVPSSIDCLDEFPTTSNGKVNLAALQDRPLISAVQIMPEGDMELRLAALWQEVLGQSCIDVTRSFFEHGGHSLLALTASSKSQVALGVAMPAMWLMQGLSLREISARLNDSQTDSEMLMFNENAEADTLYLVPGVGGDASVLHPIGQYFANARTIAAFNPAAIPVSRLNSMPDLATTLLSKLPTDLTPLLGGWSAGGVVAFAMVRALEMQGRSAAGLILLDSVMADAGKFNDEHENSHDDEVLIDWLRDMHGKSVTADQLPVALEALNIPTTEEALSALIAPWKKLSQVYRDYQSLDAVHCPVAYLRASPGATDAVVSNWQAKAQGPFRVFELKADHFGLLNDTYTGQVIQDALAWIEAVK